MMNPLEFLDLAGEWCVGAREGEWRSAASRAYYATFHVARNLLWQARFQVPYGDQCHTYLYFRLYNCGDPTIKVAAARLRDLRSLRNRADYDLDQPFDEQTAVDAVNEATDVTQTLAALAANPTLLAQVTRGIISYETAAYGSSTWKSP